MQADRLSQGELTRKVKGRQQWWSLLMATRQCIFFDQNFWKFWFTVEWNKKFLEIHFEKFGQEQKISWKFPVPFGISTQNKSVLVALFENFASTKATRWQRVNTTLDAKWSATIRACSWLPILHKNVRIWFCGKLWTGHSELPASIHLDYINLPWGNLASFSQHKKWYLGWLGKYLGRVYLKLGT